MLKFPEASFSELDPSQALQLMLKVDLNDVNQAETAISVVDTLVSGKEEGDGVGIIRYKSYYMEYIEGILY